MPAEPIPHRACPGGLTRVSIDDGFTAWSVEQGEARAATTVTSEHLCCLNGPKKDCNHACVPASRFGSGGSSVVTTPGLLGGGKPARQGLFTMASTPELGSHIGVVSRVGIFESVGQSGHRLWLGWVLRCVGEHCGLLGALVKARPPYLWKGGNPILGIRATW